MICAEVQARLMDLLCGLLPAEDARAVEAHVAACRDCGAAQDRLRRQEAQLNACFDAAVAPAVTDPGGGSHRLLTR